MPVDKRPDLLRLGERQSIEELTGGRIRKHGRDAETPAGARIGEAPPEVPAAISETAPREPGQP